MNPKRGTISHIEAVLGQAMESEQSGDWHDAERRYRDILAADATNPRALSGLGRIAALSGDLREALRLLQNAVLHAPGDTAILLTLAEVLVATADETKAEEVLNRVMSADPNSHAAATALGHLLLGRGAADEAETTYRHALTVNPNSAGTYNNLGAALIAQGRFDEAAQAFRTAIRIDPEYMEAWRHLTACQRYSDPQHPDAQAIEQRLQHVPSDSEAALHLHFALGKIYDDCGHYESAFAHYVRANALRHKTVSIDLDGYRQFIDALISCFDASLFQSPPVQGSNSTLPVFIVGMPRSGTSLIEQILAAHPRVSGRGELLTMARIVETMERELGAYPECVRRLDQKRAERFIATYEHALLTPDETAQHVTDKLPFNFRQVGLIHLLFPQARIIHCVRDARDTCLSIFLQYFSAGNVFANDLGEIGGYYVLYRRLMKHWNEVLPGRMFELRYEDLITDTETTARQLIEHIGLGWDKRCLDFQSSDHAVRTASGWQVRQSVYRRSLQRWKNYAAFLEPLETVLSRANG